MANHTVHFWCDKMAVDQVINSFSSKSERVMWLVRVFVLNCLHLNLLFLARHVPGVVNGVADALSHKQMEKFCQLAPNGASAYPRGSVENWRLEVQTAIGLSLALSTRKEYHQAVQQFEVFGVEVGYLRK